LGRLLALAANIRRGGTNALAYFRLVVCGGEKKFNGIGSQVRPVSLLMATSDDKTMGSGWLVYRECSEGTKLGRFEFEFDFLRYSLFFCTLSLHLYEC
jgi:hypothetical protein